MVDDDIEAFRGWRGISLRAKMQIGILVFALLLLATSAMVVLVTAKFYFHQKAVRDLQMLGSVLAQNSGAALVFNDQASAEKVLGALKENPAVTGAVLFKQGRVFAEYPFAGAAEKLGMAVVPAGVELVEDHYVTSIPVRVNGKEEGDLILKSDLGEWQQLESDLAKLFLLLLAGTVMLTLLASIWLKSQITRPIALLAEWATQVSRHKDFNARASKRSNDEIGHLTDSLNAMLEELSRQETIVSLNSELEKEVQERRQIEKDLIETRDRAEEANRAKSRFLANMSHELRTPLNAIIGYSEMLQETVSEEDFDRRELSADIEKVRGAGKHLLNLINDILDISKIEAGRMQISIEAFNVDQLVEEVSDTLRPLAEKRNNKLQVTKSETIGFIQSDQVKVRQILFNLLSNAVKFTHEGVVELDYHTETDGEQRWIIYAVRDTGIGISETAIHDLFQPFSQADPSTTRKYGGTGLGLAISRSYISMLGGTIEVNSEEGKGSKFVVRLPLTPVSHLSREESSGARRQGTSLGGSLMELVRDFPEETQLLLIDDEPSVHDILIHSLKKSGYAVQSAMSGEEGLQLARATRPDVIILDIFMPGMDGWQVLNVLKSDPDTASIPVLLYTIESNEARGFALGAADYLIKPINGERLLEVLSRYKRSSRAVTTVLCIDDDVHSQALVQTYLSGREWKVICASNGREGFAQLERHRDTAIILLDLIMPEMDGFEFLEACLERESIAGIPIIVISARDVTPEERARLMQHTQAVMRKGMYDKHTLVNQIREVLNTLPPHPPTEG